MEEQVLLQWSASIKMLSNLRLWKTFLLVLGIPIAALAAAVAVATGPSNGAWVLFGGLAGFGIIWVLVGMVVDVAGGFPANYTVTTSGVYLKSGKGARAAATAATIGGIVSGSPGLTGTGLLARAEQDSFIPWNEVQKVKVDKRRRYVEIRGRLDPKPIGVQCNADNFDTMLNLVETHSGECVSQ